MKKEKGSQRRVILWGFVSALIIAVFLSPLASSWPDGLERVAENLGFMKKAGQSGVTWWDRSPLADYKIPGIQSERWATALAGLLGTMVMVGLGWGIARLLRRK
jgi:cobalt/nickel transport protein